MVYGHTDLKIGTLIELEGVPYRVTEYTHKAMGRGGAVVQVKIKNLLNGGVVEKSFRSADKISPAEVTRANMQLLYREGGVRPTTRRRYPRTCLASRLSGWLTTRP
jgi:elongation factor P